MLGLLATDLPMPPRYPWPKGWRPRLEKVWSTVFAAIALASFAFAFIVKPPLLLGVAIFVVAAVIGVFRDALENTLYALGVMWGRVRHYMPLHAYAEKMTSGLNGERRHVEGLIQRLIAIEQTPYLAIRGVRIVTGEVLILIEARNGLTLERDHEVLIVFPSTAELLGRFAVVGPSTNGILARPLSIRDNGSVWWGYMVRKAKEYAVPQTEAVAVPLL